jgi:uncharacterized protein with PIN domain
LPAFVADAMLGKLARWLRALGYDCLYPRKAEDGDLLRIAREGGRWLLTRDVRLAGLATPGRVLLVRSNYVDVQVREVAGALGLKLAPVRALTRCIECNGVLEPREKEEVRDRVPPYTYATQEQFIGCPDCGKIYWAGTHVGPILERLRRLVGEE